MRLIPYINLNGRAEEALTLYQSVFGGTTEVSRWGEMPPDPNMPLSDDRKNKLMHGALTISEDVTLYLADSFSDDDTSSSRVFIHIEFDSEEALREAWDTLSEGATVNMAVDRTFWGAVYGDLVDKFGVGWGFHFQLPE